MFSFESGISIDTYQNIATGIEIHVLPVIIDLDNWLPKNHFYGCMPFLKGMELENLPETITPDLLSKCIELDQQYEAGYQESVEVKNKQDIQNLMAANENGELVYL